MSGYGRRAASAACGDVARSISRGRPHVKVWRSGAKMCGARRAAPTHCSSRARAPRALSVAPRDCPVDDPTAGRRASSGCEDSACALRPAIALGTGGTTGVAMVRPWPHRYRRLLRGGDGGEHQQTRKSQQKSGTHLAYASRRPGRGMPCGRQKATQQPARLTVGADGDRTGIAAASCLVQLVEHPPCRPRCLHPNGRHGVCGASAGASHRSSHCP